MATSVKCGFSRSINHPQIIMLVNLIFKEVFDRRSGFRLNFTASTTGNTLVSWQVLGFK